MSYKIHPYNYKEPDKICPNCSHNLIEKKVKSGGTYKRALVYDVCTNCTYKHLHPNEKETAIEDGVFDKYKNE